MDCSRNYLNRFSYWGCLLMNWLFLIMVFFPSFVGIMLLVKKMTDRTAKWIALTSSSIVFLISLYFYYMFDKTTSSFQFIIHVNWIESLGSSFAFGMDGISMSLVLLTTLLVVVVMIFMDYHSDDVKEFLGFTLILETALLGVFVALDFLLFYVFWELVLIPMYFMILHWGGPRRVYASIKFFIYTHVGSFLILVGIIAMYFYKGSADGVYTLSILSYLDYNFSDKFQLIVFPMIFIGFAIKLPLVPFHTWLPDAHVEAPTGGSMLLAGVLLKMGGYGLIRIGFTIFPVAVNHYAYIMAVFGVVSMLYGALLALAQDDLKKMVAYSSVSHMGSVVLGLAALNINGFNGATYQLFAHGIISAMLFMLCGILQYSFKTRSISKLGGLAQIVPKMTVFYVFAFMASLGLPGLAGFVAEINVLMGAFQAFKYLLAVALVSLIVTAGYYLLALQKVFFGDIKPSLVGSEFADLKINEKIALMTLTVLIVIFGLVPGPLIELFNLSNLEILARIGGV